MERSPTASEVAYCAGVLDGEGTIAITRNRPRGPTQHSPSFGLIVSVSNTNNALILFLCSLWGGTVIVSSKPKGNRRAAYRWLISGRKAVPFLKAVLPFLIIKRAEAELGIKFQSTKHYGPKRLSEKTINERQIMMDRMSALKGRLHKPQFLGLTASTPELKPTS
jgi:hypothetical protein